MLICGLVMKMVLLLNVCFFFSTEIFVCWFYSNDLAIPIVGDIVICRVSAERPLRANLCQKKCDSRSPILSRYDQVPFWIFSLKICSSPISTNDICSLCKVVKAYLHSRDELWIMQVHCKCLFMREMCQYI